MLLLSLLDPLAGASSAFAFAAAVFVNGGVDSTDDLRALLVVGAMWVLPSVMGSVVSRIPSRRLLLVSAFLRAVIASTMFVALMELLPVFTSVETKTHDFMSELVALVALVALIRSLADSVLGEESSITFRRPRLGIGAPGAGLLCVAFVVLSSRADNGWTTLGLLCLVAIVAMRLNRNPRVQKPHLVTGTVAVVIALLVGLTAVQSVGRLAPDQSTSPVADLVNNADRPVSDVSVYVDSYPEQFEAHEFADHRVLIANEDLGVALTVGSIIDGDKAVPLRNGRIQLVLGHEVRLSATGLAGQSPIETWIHSDPRQIGSDVTTPDGQVDANFEVPADQPVGQHELRLRVILSDGRSALVTIPVDVVATVPEETF